MLSQLAVRWPRARTIAFSAQALRHRRTRHFSYMSASFLKHAALENAAGAVRDGEDVGHGKVLALYFAVRPIFRLNELLTQALPWRSRPYNAHLVLAAGPARIGRLVPRLPRLPASAQRLLRAGERRDPAAGDRVCELGRVGRGPARALEGQAGSMVGLAVRQRPAQRTQAQGASYR